MDEILRLRAKAVVDAADAGDMRSMADAVLALRSVLLSPPLNAGEVAMVKAAAKRALGEGRES